MEEKTSEIKKTLPQGTAMPLVIRQTLRGSYLSPSELNKNNNIYSGGTPRHFISMIMNNNLH